MAEHRYLYVELEPERAGHGMVTLFVEDFDPEMSETYQNGVRKVTYRDRQRGRCWRRPDRALKRPTGHLVVVGVSVELALTSGG